MNEIICIICNWTKRGHKVDTESTGSRVKGKPAGHTQDTRFSERFKLSFQLKL